MSLNIKLINGFLYSFWYGFLVVVSMGWIFSFNLHPQGEYDVFIYGALIEEIVKGIVALRLITKGMHPWSTVGIGVGFGLFERVGLLRYGEGWMRTVTRMVSLAMSLPCCEFYTNQIL